jgi:hypothetical protein
MAEESQTPLGVKATPVYIPWATLISSLDNLHTHGIPATGKIDKSLWETQAGSVQGQLILAYRFLGFIDSNNKVLPPLPPVADATPEKRKELLRKIVEDKYATVLSKGLETISPGQLKQAFEAFGVSGSTLDRAIRFFIKACQELGIPISKRVSEKLRTLSPGPRKARRSNGAKPVDEEEEPDDRPRHNATWEEKLLEKFPAFDPAWPDDLKTKWFAGFKDLMETKKD